MSRVGDHRSFPFQSLDQDAEDNSSIRPSAQNFQVWQAYPNTSLQVQPGNQEKLIFIQMFAPLNREGSLWTSMVNACAVEQASSFQSCLLSQSEQLLTYHSHIVTLSSCCGSAGVSDGFQTSSPKYAPNILHSHQETQLHPVFPAVFFIMAETTPELEAKLLKRRQWGPLRSDPSQLVVRWYRNMQRSEVQSNFGPDFAGWSLVPFFPPGIMLYHVVLHIVQWRS